MKHRDRVDLFLTLLAGLPLLASGAFGLWYVTTEMLTDYRPALWVAQGMAAILLAVGASFCWAAWRRRRQIKGDYHLLYQTYPELATDWSRLDRQATVSDATLGLYVYGQHLIVTAQGLISCPLDQVSQLDYRVVPTRVGRHLQEDHLILAIQRQTDRHAQLRDLGRATPDRVARLDAFLAAATTRMPAITS